MNGPRIGSLFSGYGGLDMGVMEVLGGEVAWHVEYDAAPSKILEHHWPDVPNFGDVTALDWSSVASVDVITAGYPCQPFSMIGKRKGSTDERHLWPHVLDSIRQLRPRIVVLENVRGHLTLGFDRVLGDLAEVGYDARWICLPASAAGAPHRRERIFVVSFPADSSDDGQQRPGGSWLGRAGSPNCYSPPPDPRCVESERWRGSRGMDGASRGGQGATGKRERDGDAVDDRGAVDWREYAPAIARWEHILGRMAPAPTAPDGRNGQHRLAARFVEWMMGLPEGHVTAPAIGLTRAQQLKALGNGVLPQQAALALRLLGAG